MYCFLSKFRGETSDCQENECAMWNHDRNECAIRSYCEAYLTMGRATLMMSQKIENFETALEEDDDD